MTAMDCLEVLATAMQSVSTWEYVKKEMQDVNTRIGAFNVAWDLLLAHKFPDCSRYDKEFFEQYDCKENSTMHLMFKSFVMGIDFILGC